MNRILVIQDFSIIGKSSGNVSLSIFTSMGMEVFFIPVFVQLSKFDFQKQPNVKVEITDLSEKLSQYAEYFTENKIHFDGIFVSGKFSYNQIQKISDLIDACITDDCFLISSLLDYNSEIPLNTFYEKSNLLFMKLSQISFISGNNFNNNFNDKLFVEKLIKKVSKILSGSFIVTDFFINDKKNSIILSERNFEDVKWFYHINYNDTFFGLYDIFSAIVAGSIFKRVSLKESVDFGIKFIEKAVKKTLSKSDHNWYGTDFESILCDLHEK